MVLTNNPYFRLLYKSILKSIPHNVLYAMVVNYQKNIPPYHLVNTGDTVIQVGAAGPLCALGRSQSIIYSNLVGDSGNVFSYEAIPENFNTFKNYIDKYKISNINGENIGLWKVEKKIQFNASEEGNYSLGSRIQEVRKNENYYYKTHRELPVSTLTNLFVKYDMNKVNVINITTNGGECDILSGGMELIERFSPVLCVPEREENNDYFNDNIKKLGYKIYKDDVKLHILGRPISIIWAVKG